MTNPTGVESTDWNQLAGKHKGLITQNYGVSAIYLCSIDAFTSVNGIML